MRFLLYVVIPVFLMLSITGCQSHDDETEALEAQAITLHDSLLVIENQVRGTLALVTGEHATPALAAPLLDSIGAIQADLENWSEYVIEPPGAHEGHDHAHDHNHSHEPPPDITPQQMVEIQQALLNEIAALEVRLEQLNIDIEPATSEHAHDHDDEHHHDDEHEHDEEHRHDDDEHEQMHRDGIEHDH